MIYNIGLGVCSLRRNPWLTAFIICAVGFGVAATITTYAVLRVVSANPIPWKSSKLYVPMVDSWGPQYSELTAGGMPDALTYIDATAMMRDGRAELQSAMYQVSLTVSAAGEQLHPLSVEGQAVSSQFFPMLDVPFMYGNGWVESDDSARAAVAVISGRLNQMLFGGVNSIGRTIRLDGQIYQIVGVLNNWNPRPRYYDVIGGSGFPAVGDDVFIPFQQAIASGIAGNISPDCVVAPEPGLKGLEKSSCVWISYMVELDDAEAVNKYRRYLWNYAHEQDGAGRFTWAPNTRLLGLMDWLSFENVAPPETEISLMLALGLLVACLVNASGLLEGKVALRSNEIGLRRSLGARRIDIYVQFLAEACIIGLLGGVVGVAFTILSIKCLSWVIPENLAVLVRISPFLLLLTISVSLISTALAGVFPAVRAARVSPSWAIKLL